MNNGLSPLARGTLDRLIHASHSHRFIPAGAGNTDSLAGAVVAEAVYPRWRGEHLHPSLDTKLTVRFIPAGAGNTDIAVSVMPASSVYPRWRGEHK